MKEINLLFQGFTVTYYNARPDFLVYHTHEYHVFDLKVKLIMSDYLHKLIFFQMCQCAEISFGTVDEVMNWCGELVYYHYFESCKMKVKHFDPF